jgi:uncharacterized protein YgbK (DUF1537 family)
MQIPGLNVGIVADDLTGACDTALQFFSSHAKSHVLMNVPRLAQAPLNPAQTQENQVWSINTSTRHMDSHEAQTRVRRGLMSRPLWGGKLLQKDGFHLAR